MQSCQVNHGTFPITCYFTLSCKNLLWFNFQIKLNSPSNSQPSTMQWHDMIVLKTLFLKELVSKSAILNEFLDFEIKQFWNQTFFFRENFFFRHWAVRSWASQTDPEFLTESQKSSQQNSAVFHTRQYSGTHYARFCEFFVLKLFEILKVNRNMFFISINRHFDTIFYSKFIYNFRTDFIESGYSVLLGKLDPQRTENKISIIQSRAKNLRQTFFITKEWLISKSLE